MKLTIFGFLCRDRNILPNGQMSEIVGGKGLFTAAAASRSGVDVELVTWLPDDDRELLGALSDYPVTTHVIPIPKGTVNTNTHNGDTTLATTFLDPYSISISDFTEEIRAAVMSSDLVLLMPDIESKISVEAIRYLSDDLGVPVAADIGKYFRTLLPDGTLEPRYPWPMQADVLRSLQTVFVSIEDIAPALDQGESLLSLAHDMAEQGPSEIVITQGSKGVTVFHRETNDFAEFNAYPPEKLVDPTGAGDTFVGAYVAEHLLTDSFHSAARFGAMAASIKLAYPGPLRESRSEIAAALEERPTT